MTSEARKPDEADATEGSGSKNVDPRNTDHPAGAAQADENAATESPS